MCVHPKTRILHALAHMRALSCKRRRMMDAYLRNGCTESRGGVVGSVADAWAVRERLRGFQSSCQLFYAFPPKRQPTSVTNLPDPSQRRAFHPSRSKSRLYACVVFS